MKKETKYLALAAAALGGIYILTRSDLGGVGGLEGGGEGTKKATVTTGVLTPENYTAPNTAPAASSPSVSTFQPSQYLLDMMYQRDIEPGIIASKKTAQAKTVGGSSVSTEFFAASTTPTYGANQKKGETYKSDSPNTVAAVAENAAYSNTNYGQLGKSVFGSQYTAPIVSKKAEATTVTKSGTSVVTSSSGNVVASSRNTGRPGQTFTSRGWVSRG
jgi:hypothetical protein